MEAQLNTKKMVSLMLVEDEIDALQLLNDVLIVKYPSITLYTAINGKIAMELFKTHLPDIVITDINMPEICGNQLIATKTRNLLGLSFRFQIQTIMKKHFENVFDSW